MDNKSKNGSKIALAILGGILVGALLGTYIFCVATHTKFSELFGSPKETPTVSVSTSETTVAGESSTQSTTTLITTTPTTTASSSSDKLYLPDQSKYVERYDAEIWSEEIEYDEYINIRYGPSKTDYEVIKKVRNGTFAEGLTDSVNGWSITASRMFRCTSAGTSPAIGTRSPLHRHRP